MIKQEISCFIISSFRKQGQRRIKRNQMKYIHIKKNFETNKLTLYIPGSLFINKQHNLLKLFGDHSLLCKPPAGPGASQKIECDTAEEDR